MWEPWSWPWWGGKEFPPIKLLSTRFPALISPHTSNLGLKSQSNKREVWFMCSHEVAQDFCMSGLVRRQSCAAHPDATKVLEEIRIQYEVIEEVDSEKQLSRGPWFSALLFHKGHLSHRAETSSSTAVHTCNQRRGKLNSGRELKTNHILKRRELYHKCWSKLT